MQPIIELVPSPQATTQPLPPDFALPHLCPRGGCECEDCSDPALDPASSAPSEMASFVADATPGLMLFRDLLFASLLLGAFKMMLESINAEPFVGAS